MEDYASPTDISPLSSTPLQFLVNVFYSTASCSSVPEFVSPTREDGSRVAVPSGTTYHERIVVEVTSSPSVRYDTHLMISYPHVHAYSLPYEYVFSLSMLQSNNAK